MWWIHAGKFVGKMVPAPWFASFGFVRTESQALAWLGILSGQISLLVWRVYRGNLES
jgi:hypothetical protein